jgi:glutaredoxin
MFNRLRTKLDQLARGKRAPAEPGVAGAPVPAKAREPAPVMVYYEKDRNQRLIERVRELLESKQIPFRALDVSGDPATLAFIVREAKCEEDDLPVVFIAGTAVGGFNELVDWDVSGKLKLAVFGA